MKLKTLKDIPMGYNKTEGITSPTELRMYERNVFYALKKDLRQEAINDIKEIKKAVIYPFGKDIPILDSSNKLSKFAGAIEYIIWKFNITEEDLK